ncbi:MAG: hypothetical protein C4K49_10960 [Candidatus Thorarchaeota archaeon]|nr:MAG: hypothetical protein C4K49_10960 [Candidatus Thorarchaeota archaeon]
MFGDDFFSAVDRLIDELMRGTAMRQGWNDPIGESVQDVSADEENQPHVDTSPDDAELIDMGDSLLVVVNCPMGVEAPTARVQGRQLIIRPSVNDERDIKLELPYTIDVKNSRMSSRNGVIEIRLPRFKADAGRKQKDGEILSE